MKYVIYGYNKVNDFGVWVDDSVGYFSSYSEALEMAEKLNIIFESQETHHFVGVI